VSNKGCKEFDPPHGTNLKHMYSRTRTKVPDNITLDWILSKATEYDIYAQYLGQFKVGMIYNSPFRKDKNPSFGIYYSKRAQKLLFKDHGTGDCGDVIKFVQLLTGKTNYDEILKDIVAKLNITNTTKLVSSKQYIPPTETVIGVVRQDFTESDINYWSQFNIDTKTLKKFNVSSIKYYLCNGIVKGIYKDENPMYAYKVYNNFKIYRPLGDKYTKWRNNLTELDIQGYEQLPKAGDTLFVTKSMKDVMCLYKMGYSAISPSSESTFIPNNIIEALKKRFKRIIVLFDRDVAGVRNSRKISLKMGLEAMFIHKRFKAKDVSDAIKGNGFETINKWLHETVDKHQSKECNKS
jgi:5S rRNA maturation endonuclease (ribonuclease M5)